MVPLALILSSFVAASRIGGAAQQYVLAAHRIDPVLVPTVMMGRNPARGSGGQATPPELFARMLADVEADALFGMVDLVITGHFSSAEQVEIAADALARIQAASSRAPVVVVDPILGDAPNGLYVKPEVARAVAERLVPLADWITPNLWELAHLAGAEPADPAAAAAAARRLGKPALVTSSPAGPGEIGLLLVEAETATLFAHPRLAQAPNGTGDLVAASFGAGLVEGLTPYAAAERAARAASETVSAAQDWAAPDLPIIALGERLVRPTAPLRIERL
ncbi:MAG TPA: PfkB family carbohydrate kinase [Phenylobacterium sp.]|jgi:pyridoxine kinase|uniref:PfkB family carbohydrate kinase n=1 Tax=Phenylobacterium sp. TaxID=1871053 RepID=UPI002C2EAE27|nr:PfkB family carbohydrate kinase [Phenylobacterium sp.]HXA39061.1 PfkB family carbohydrate kinase [Phenylobacterium sp.]